MPCQKLPTSCRSLPPPADGPTQPTTVPLAAAAVCQTYIVQSGDTSASIATQFNVQQSALCCWRDIVAHMPLLPVPVSWPLWHLKWITLAHET